MQSAALSWAGPSIRDLFRPEISLALKSILFKNALANFVSDIGYICIANSGSELTKDSETSYNLSLQIF